MRLGELKPQTTAAVGVVAVLLATVALANGAQDGEAGLATLQRGDYQGAVRLFTRALDDRHLVRADRELAHLSRGRAYLALGRRDEALADFRFAVQLAPGDAEAQAAFREAQNASTATAAPPPVARSPPRPRLGPESWGLLASLAGRYFWYEVPGTAAKAAFIHYEWVTPGRTLAYQLRNKSKTTMVGLFIADPESGRILESSVVEGRARYQTVDAKSALITEYGFSNGVASRQISALRAGDLITSLAGRYDRGQWFVYSRYTLLPTTREELVEAKLLRSP